MNGNGTHNRCTKTTCEKRNSNILPYLKRLGHVNLALLDFFQSSKNMRFLKSKLLEFLTMLTSLSDVLVAPAQQLVLKGDE